MVRQVDPDYMKHAFQKHQAYLLNARHSFWGVLILTIAVITVYWQVWNFDFISFDDPAYVINTCLKVKNSDDSILWIFRFHQSDGKYWQPLTLLSHIADCRMFGPEPGLHHFTNLIFHLLNSILLFLFLRLILTDFWKSFWIAMLFAIHPMNVESVAWISERKNLISSFFFFLSLIAYCRYVKQPNRSKYLILTFIFILGLLAKPMLVTLPVILLLLDWWPLQRLSFQQNTESAKHNFKPDINLQKPLRYCVFEKIPLIFLSFMAVYMTIYSVIGERNLSPETTHSIKLRLANAILSIVVYIGKILWPFNLSVFYPYPETIDLWKLIVAVFLLIFLSFLFFKRFKSSPYLILGWLWFLITLLPVLGILQAGLWPALADRWVYIPAIGLFVIIIFAGEKIFIQYLPPQKIRFLFACFFTSILMIITWHQVRHWRDGMSLYKQALRATTGNVMAHNNLGNILMEKGLIDQAAHHFQQAIQIDPSYTKAQINLANAWIDRGRAQEALEIYQKLLKKKPGDAQIYNNMGNAFLQINDINQAMRYYISAVQKNPNYAEAYNNIGVALWKNGQKNKSMAMFQKALSIDRDYKRAYENMVTLTSEQKDTNQELQQLLNKSFQSPEDPILLFQLGQLFQKENKPYQSIIYYQKALELKPDWYEAQKNLAVSFAMKGDYKAAFAIFQRFIRQNPNNSDAYYYMASIRSRQNNVMEAIQWLQKAIDHGFSDWKSIQTDSNLSNIRSSRLFRKLFTRHMHDQNPEFHDKPKTRNSSVSLDNTNG